ncbi:MAG TPA: L-tyrosine/L-tryptophan isonitrile synthase family protein [Candidatus Saccharimonadia bacterium]|nr:L-tyrosine/L-tryptophan isonitrile synthase family protein [Candidatus Saccharimonadia bacterium]
MTAQEYIQSELERCADYALTGDDKTAIEQQGIEAFIYAKLTSKKFRKWAVDESSELQAKRAIGLNVSAGKPLQFRYPFGGYKLWRMPSSPEVDWAEFFAIAYYCKYLASIAAAYKPGIEFLFASDDMIIERMDNVPIADTDAYFNSFKKLLEQFRSHFPANFKMDIVRIGDLYEDKEAMEQELAANVERLKQEYATTVDPARKQKMLTTSELNVRLDGAKDLTKLNEDEKRAVIEMGPVYHDAYCALSKRREFNRGENKIVIFTTVVPNAIAIGTTKSSITKYWTGFGILEADGNSFKSRIISPTQLEKLDGQRFELVSTNLFDLRNFKDIRVY